MADNKYTVEYATSNRSKCKDSKCKEGIESGTLRIGKITKNTFSSDEDALKTEWYHYQCIFSALKRARKDTKKIESEDDLEGFSKVKSADQQKIKDLIAGGDAEEEPKKGTKRKKSPAKKEKKEKKRKKSPKRRKKKMKTKTAMMKEVMKMRKNQRKKIKKEKKKSPTKEKKASSSGDGETKRFVCESSSDDGKFWEITIDGSVVSTRHGKVGSDGTQGKPKDHGDEEKAQKDVAKQIKAKEKKGYALEE